MKAAVILTKCPKANRIFGMRTELRSDGDWYRTWAFPIREERARQEGYDTTPVRGHLTATEEYPGCPFCKTMAFMQCGACQKLSCWNGETEVVCPWCNARLTTTTYADMFSVDGSGGM